MPPYESMFVCGMIKRRENQLNKNCSCPALLSHLMDMCLQEVLIHKNTWGKCVDVNTFSLYKTRLLGGIR